MSYSHCAERLPLPTPTAALGTLRARGLRISTRAAGSSTRCSPPTRLRPPRRSPSTTGADLASVYRNLDALEEAGIAHHVHVGHAAGRYVLSGRHAGGYAACERCGRHVALQPGDLAGLCETVRALTGFACDFSHFPIVGACPDCEATR